MRRTLSGVSDLNLRFFQLNAQLRGDDHAAHKHSVLLSPAQRMPALSFLGSTCDGRNIAFKVV